VRQYTVHDTETSLDTVLLRAEYSEHSSSLSQHQRAKGGEASSRMLQELLNSKQELAELDAYPLSVPTLNMFAFGNSIVIVLIVIFILLIMLIVYCQYRRWKTTD